MMEWLVILLALVALGWFVTLALDRFWPTWREDTFFAFNPTLRPFFSDLGAAIRANGIFGEVASARLHAEMRARQEAVLRQRVEKMVADALKQKAGDGV